MLLTFKLSNADDWQLIRLWFCLQVALSLLWPCMGITLWNFPHGDRNRVEP